MKIQNIIDKSKELKVLSLLNDKDPIYGEENQFAKLELEIFLQSSLTSLLDSLEKELPEVTPIKDGSFLEEEVTNYAQMRYRKEVINIINSHK